MIRYRALFEDLTGLHEGHGEPGRDRVAAIRDRAAGRHAAGNGTRAAETAEPVTEAPVTGESAAADRDLAVQDDEVNSESSSRSAPPRR